MRGASTAASCLVCDTFMLRVHYSNLPSSVLGKVYYALYLGSQALAHTVSQHCFHAMVDGTFGLIPGRISVLNVRASQVMNVLCDYKGAVICVLTFVMSGRKLPLYTEIFRWFATEIKAFRPKEIITDFEPALRVGIQKALPGTRVLLPLTRNCLPSEPGSLLNNTIITSIQ